MRMTSCPWRRSRAARRSTSTGSGGRAPTRAAGGRARSTVTRRPTLCQRRGRTLSRRTLQDSWTSRIRHSRPSRLPRPSRPPSHPEASLSTLRSSRRTRRVISPPLCISRPSRTSGNELSRSSTSSARLTSFPALQLPPSLPPSPPRSVLAPAHPSSRGRAATGTRSLTLPRRRGPAGASPTLRLHRQPSTRTLQQSLSTPLPRLQFSRPTERRMPHLPCRCTRTGVRPASPPAPSLMACPPSACATTLPSSRSSIAPSTLLSVRQRSSSPRPKPPSSPSSLLPPRPLAPSPSSNRSTSPLESPPSLSRTRSTPTSS